MNELLYKIPANTPREEVIRLLKAHPEVRFVSLVGIDMAGNDTDEKIPVRIFIEDIEKFYNGTAVQTDGSSVVLPKIALLPVVMLLFGVGEWSKLILVFLIIVFQVVVAVRDAVAAIPSETYAPLRVLGASFAQIVRHIIVPASLPKFITAVRVAMATAISVLFFTETFGTQYGIGYYIMDAWLRVNYLDMYAGIVVLSAMGLLLFILLDWTERRMCAWNHTS